METEDVGTMRVKPWMVALLAGAAGGGIVWIWGKRRLESQFGAGAEGLRSELERSGSRLRTDVELLARKAAIVALRDEFRRLGITEELVRETTELAQLIDNLADSFRASGLDPARALDQIRARARAIAQGIASGFGP